MIINPGILGWNELRAQGEEVDLVVQVQGRRFGWTMIYPEQKVQSFRELVLPVGARTRFNVESFDVLHSFWIPAFRIKIDAVPGIITSVTATPDQRGTFDDDTGFRVQCAEICGIGHATMNVPVRVVDQAEFDAWIAEQRPIRE